MTNFGEKLISQFRATLDECSLETLNTAVRQIVDAKKRGGKVMVVTGSGPNIHEGVTTLIAEMIHKGLIDAVSTSSVVVAHEMSGSFEREKRIINRVQRVSAQALGINPKAMPRGDLFEFTVMQESELDALEREMILDRGLFSKADTLPRHSSIIKAAGNMAYSMGLRSELLATEILKLAQLYGLTFEETAGYGCDPMTMLGAGAAKGVPVLVTIPQLIGGGRVGMAIGDSIPISRRSMLLAKMLERSDIIIKSAVALVQEMHDDPPECYTGHGIWAWWQGEYTYSLKGKSLIRFDLDENLRKATDLERADKTIQEAIDKGLPKTKVANMPFRMEMSTFARHEGSLPVIGDIGKIWPVVAYEVARELGVRLDFISASQDTPEGQAMCEWIVNHIKPLNRETMIKKLRTIT